jgi:predicted nucleic acid-binding protein
VITYIDTSVFVKLLIDEAGTPEAGPIWDHADVLAAARILHVEVRSALASAHRQRRLTSANLRAAIAGLQLLWSQLSVVEIDDRVVRLAGDLAAAHGLRGYDAVHLAAAELVGADVFSSADHRLCSAARSSGFHIANPLDAKKDR